MSETQSQKKDTKSLAKRIGGIVVNVLVVLVLIVVLFISISVISSRGKGYTTFFGKAFVAVESYSMVGEKEDSFTRGDLIVFDELDDAEKQTLEEGQIVTFYDSIDGVRVLNTHRIINIGVNDVGTIVTVETMGDANDVADPVHLLDDIVGRKVSIARGVGHFFLFFNSQWGFFTCIVLPSFLIVIFCVVNLILAIRENRRLKVGVSEAEKAEQIKRQLLEDLAAQGIIPKDLKIESENSGESGESSTETSTESGESGENSDNSNDKE